MKDCELHLGDYLDVIKIIPDKSINLILTDIPYNVSRDNNFKTMKDRTGRNGIDFGEWDRDFDITGLSNLSRVLVDGGSIVLFHALEQYSEVRKVLEGSGLICKDKLIWEKTNPMPRNRDRRYISNIEMASWYVTKKGKWTFNRQDEKYEKCVLRYPSESGGGFKRYHPNQKNKEMLKYLLRIHSNEGDIVLDPFMGSGSTGVACKELNREFIGIELDKNYFNIAKERLNQ